VRLSGARGEFNPIDLAAADADGNPIIPENSHVGIAHRAVAAGSRILRRSYSYDDGANMIAERWPPWKQGMEFDAVWYFPVFNATRAKGSFQYSKRCRVSTW
jgi:deferrochelatase/peroxidase EfeB